MAGIYIHIPFCKQKCIYCNFYSVASFKSKTEYLQALCKEIELQQNYLQGEKVSTIYIGGGTPTTLLPNELQNIFIELEKYFDITNDAEITIEANPEQLTRSYLSELAAMHKINRFSIGIQSFQDKDLQLLNRKHSTQQAIDAVKTAQEFGFENISIDLIYGIPNLSNECWEKNLETAFELGVKHLSCYSLTVEAKTALHLLIEKQQLPAPDENKSIEQFEILMAKAAENGFEQYEISNLSLPGFASKHNSNYWNGTPYLGLGASAHSFNGTARRWNCSNLKEYIENIAAGKPVYEEEVLSQTDIYNEYIMTALRTSWGISKAKLLQNFDSKYLDYFNKKIQTQLKKGFVLETENNYSLSKNGKLFADGIASELFF